jgi:hypothetical protein
MAGETLSQQTITTNEANDINNLNDSIQSSEMIAQIASTSFDLPISNEIDLPKRVKSESEDLVIGDKLKLLGWLFIKFEVHGKLKSRIKQNQIKTRLELF